VTPLVRLTLSLDCAPLPQPAKSSLQAITEPPQPPPHTSRTVSVAVPLHVLMSQDFVTVGVKDHHASWSTDTLQAVAGPSSVAELLSPATPAGPVPPAASTNGVAQVSFGGTPPSVAVTV
jgi:hypothetical protein